MGKDEEGDETEAEGRQKDQGLLEENMCFPTQFGGDEETTNLEEALRFWQCINNKEVADGWR